MEQAILIGMPMDLFWHEEPQFYDIYVKAYKTSIKNNYELINTTSWLTGVYVQRAVISALDGKKHKYPEKPMECFKDNRELSPIEQQAEMVSLHKQLKNWSIGFKGKGSKGT